jgi:hypothetical protein
VDDPDLKDSVHDAPNLRDSSPPVPFLVVQGIEPLLDFKRLDVLCDLVTPLGNQEVANLVVKNRLRVLRLRTGSDFRIEFNLEVIFRKLAIPHPTTLRNPTVNPDPQTQPIRFKRCLVLGREVIDQTHYQRSLLCTVDSVTQHPNPDLQAPKENCWKEVQEWV